MKFPRNARIFRGQLDMAPYAGVFFLLLIFLLLGSLVYTPGVHIELPIADDLPGTDKPTIAVAMDSGGRLYFRNQLVDESQLGERLREAAREAGEPLTLVVQADKGASYELLMRLTLLARREAGITQAWLATLPRAFALPASPRKP